MSEAKFDEERVVNNYYRANNSLIEIASTPNIPKELKQLATNASVETIKIIDYINKHR